MLAGGIGGTTGDLLMHSIDTVKTRQQGDTSMPSKYTSLSSTYAKIFRQEGIRRGLYSGVTPAFLGSFPGTVIFFGVYEYSKRYLIDSGLHHSLAYLSGGVYYVSIAIEVPILIIGRIHRRSRCLRCLRSLRSPQDAIATTRSLQQSFLQLGLQLPFHSRRLTNHSS